MNFLEMTRREISNVHGYSIPELEELLSASCDLFKSRVNLQRESFDGWSNINIRGRSFEIDFVLKLPWLTNAGPSYYEYLYKTSEFYGNLGITPSPLFMGTLTNQEETPFIILEYLDGKTHETIHAFSNQEIKLFNTCLKQLHQQKPPHLHTHYSPLDYLLTHQQPIEDHQGLSTCSTELGLLIHSFNEIEQTLLDYAELLGSWALTVMHGDLWIPNVVLQHDKALLLDLESCAFGDSHFDLARLLESHEPPADPPLNLIDGYDERMIHELRPVALGYIILWSLERLLSMESGLVEPNLCAAGSRDAILEFTRGKIARLKDIL